MTPDPIMQRLDAIENGVRMLWLRELLADVAIEYHVGDPAPDWRASHAPELVEIRAHFGVAPKEGA